MLLGCAVLTKCQHISLDYRQRSLPEGHHRRVSDVDFLYQAFAWLVTFEYNDDLSSYHEKRRPSNRKRSFHLFVPLGGKKGYGLIPQTLSF
jgi:hypothetical protein